MAKLAISFYFLFKPASTISLVPLLSRDASVVQSAAIFSAGAYHKDKKWQGSPGMPLPPSRRAAKHQRFRAVALIKVSPKYGENYTTKSRPRHIPCF